MSSLTLSGGGFRATLFHLGVINYLRAAKKLKEVKHIYSVSGGSILAAHLVLHWEDYNNADPTVFGPVTQKLVDFTRRDIRGRVIRRWLFYWSLAAMGCLLPLNVLPYFQPFGLGLAWSLGLGLACLAIGAAAFPWLRRTWSRIKLLEHEYVWLFGVNKLANLDKEERPKLYLLNTDLTSADFCSFGGKGVHLVLRDPNTDKTSIKLFGSTSIPVAFGVAASSAYPALFPPVRLTPGMIAAEPHEMPHPHYLADGGVYENLGTGVRSRLKLADDAGPLVVSDAQRETGTLFNAWFDLIFMRTVRTTDILMKRVNESEVKALAASLSFKAVHLKLLPNINSYPTDQQPLNETVQRRILNVRTDLDAFSPAEIQLLIYQGYAAALRAYEPAAAIPGFQFHESEPMPYSAPGGQWLPYAKGDGRLDRNALQALCKSDQTRLGLFAWRAPLFYVNCILLFLLLGFLYPSLLAWAWLANVLPSHVRSNLPVDAAYVPLNEESEAFMRTLALTCGDAAKDGQAVHYRAGPFNASGSRPIGPFMFVLPLADGYVVRQSYAFLVKRQQGNQYEELPRDLERTPGNGNRIRVKVPSCEGDDSLLLIVCVQRKVGVGDWPDAAKLFQAPEVKP